MAGRLANYYSEEEPEMSAATAGHDPTRLPKWAQRRIQALERETEHLRGQLSPNPADANTFANPYLDTRNPDSKGIPVGRDETIRFYFDEEPHGRPGYIDVRLDSDRRDGQYIRVSGSGGLIVRPHASNVVEVSPEA